MHYQVYKAAATGPAAEIVRSILAKLRGADQATLRWLKFGDRYFVYGSDVSPATASMQAGGLTLEDERTLDQISSEFFCLVTQKDRRFQDLHPDIPVLFNRGRYLLVSLSGPTAQLIGTSIQPGYTVSAVRGSEVVYDVCPRPSSRPLRDPAIQALVKRTSCISVEANTTTLASYRTRNSLTLLFRQASEWAAEKLAAMGYEVTIEAFRVPRTPRSPSGRSVNVVAERRGALTDGRRLIVVVAHLDSVNWRAPT